MNNPIRQIIRDKFFNSDEEFEEALEGRKKIFDKKFSYTRNKSIQMGITMIEDLTADKNLQPSEVMLILTMVSVQNIAIIASELPEQAIGHFLDEMIVMIKSNIADIKRNKKEGENATD